MQVDAIIIGQGLAGSAMAWTLHTAGLSVMLVDRCEQVTASGIAAGLLTPVTGRRMVRAENFDQQFAAASEFYRSVERLTGTSCFADVAMVRLFRDEQERKLFLQQRLTEYRRQVRVEYTSGGLAAGFEMYPAARLQTAKYLQATRRYFQDRGEFRAAELHLPDDVRLLEQKVEIPSLELTGEVLVLCQGYQREKPAWFPEVPDAPARGDILRVRLPLLHEHRVLHSGIWLVPDGDETWLLGSTYDWQQLTNEPLAAGREQLLQQLSELLGDHVGSEVEVVAHQAAVRAGMKHHQPVARQHADHPRLAILNGLGAKGSLRAPVCAQQLTRQLSEQGLLRIRKQQSAGSRDSWSAGVPLQQSDNGKSDSERTEVQGGSDGSNDRSSRRRSLTRLVHELLSEVIRRGDRVIDATAGNGYDTLFLAQQTGPGGEVIALDIQPAALQNTRRRLDQAGIHQVRLLQQSHATVEQLAEPGSVAAITFNLGYLPGSDKTVTTTIADTTLAIRQSVGLLRRGGMLTVIAYRGHPGGTAEATAVRQLLSQLSPGEGSVEHWEADPNDHQSPELFVVRRS